MNSIFGPVRQLAYVVEDMDQAVERWHEQTGLRPFAVTPECRPFEGARYRGADCSDILLRLGFAYIGDIQLELIQQLNEAPSIYREAMARGHTGLHHYGVCVEDFAAVRQDALNRGFTAVVDAGSDKAARMSYLESDQIKGLIFELIEWNRFSRPYFDGVRQFLSEADPAQLKHEFPL